MKTHNLAIFGCGDFLRWQADSLKASKRVRVAALYDPDAGNDREHIDLFYLVTDKGWRITREWRDGQPVILASREGRQEVIPCQPVTKTHYDAFAEHIGGGPFPRALASLADASRDVRLVRRG